jgi:hypothetical protein
VLLSEEAREGAPDAVADEDQGREVRGLGHVEVLAPDLEDELLQVLYSGHGVVPVAGWRVLVEGVVVGLVLSVAVVAEEAGVREAPDDALFEEAVDGGVPGAAWKHQAV